MHDSILIGIESTITTTPLDTGINDYILITYDSICSDTDSVAIYVVPVDVDAGPDYTINEGACVVLLGSVTNGAIYLWSPEDYLSLRNSRTSSVGERFALWVQSIDQANKENVPTLPAREMYSGATWHAAKRLNTVAKNQGFKSTHNTLLYHK